MKPIKFLAAIAALLLAAANEASADPVAIIAPAVLKTAEAKHAFLNALAATKSDNDLQKLGTAIDHIAEAMNAVGTTAKTVQPLTTIQKRELEAIGLRREYELFHHRSMDSEMAKVPAALQPRVAALFESRKDKMAEIERVHDALFEINDRKRSHTAQAHSLELKPPFFANISFGNETDALKDPLQFVVVSVEVFDPADQSFLILYRQEAPWTGVAPNTETLKSWIKWDDQGKTIRFDLPENQFTYRLPKTSNP